MNNPDVTLVVVPRERFSYTRQSLESIYQYTKYPFELVYVDGNSPQHIQEYLIHQAEAKNFQLVRCDRYLAPNQARNIGLQQVNTKYVVFVDNDIHVTEGWLEKLVKCAEAESATVVCPLVCIGKDLHSKIHLAGGEASIYLEIKNDVARRKIQEKHYYVNRPVAEVREQLVRRECKFAEFHCLLVRKDIFDTIGNLDEKLLCTREHTDFSLSVIDAGGTIYCEPDSVTTYVPDSGFEFSDLAYFMLRWSDAWEIASLEHFRDKWNVSKKDKYFKKRYKRLGYRRHNALLRPFAKKIAFGSHQPWLEKILIAAERKLNDYICDRYSQVVR